MLDQCGIRKEKMQKLSILERSPYADRYDRTHSCAAASELYEGTENVRLAGRVIAIRKFGKLTFGHIQDWTGKIQFALQKMTLEDEYKQFHSFVDIADFVGFEGNMIITKTGEKTLEVRSWTMLSKTLRPLPEKWHGITDIETCHRQRYLDLTMNADTLERFKTRARVIKTIRHFLEDNDFLEVDTPVLQTKPSGALATPFVTHHNAYDMDVYLRIAPETYLKRAVAGGLERVYEFARCFRNEGLDPSHLQDFTLLEYYCAYWNYEDNMDFTEKLVKHVVRTVNQDSETLSIGDRSIDFSGQWPRITFRELIQKDCGIDINAHTTAPSLLQAITAENIELEDREKLKTMSRGNLVDVLYKKVSRPKIINPVFLTAHPTDLSPLARRNDQNPDVTDRFQLVVNGWEIVNAYSELVDPIDQRQRLEEQATARDGGDEEAMVMDEDFLLCMEHGMPPISGWGMGIDRFTALLTGQENLREVILFPLMKPEE